MKNDIDLGAVMEKLRWLRLPGMTRALEGICERARKDNLTPGNFFCTPRSKRGT